MMPENERRNPFEDHIESDAFDISQLGAPGDPSRLQEQVNTLLNSLPQPLDYRLWDEELDDIQKQLCIYLATAVIERYIRPGHAEEMSAISDDELLTILHVPLALAMIVQQRLYIPPRPVIDALPRLPHPPATIPERPLIAPRLWQRRIRNWLAGLRDRLSRLFNRPY